MGSRSGSSRWGKPRKRANPSRRAPTADMRAAGIGRDAWLKRVDGGNASIPKKYFRIILACWLYESMAGDMGMVCGPYTGGR